MYVRFICVLVITMMFGVSPALAISISQKFVMPLTTPYPVCNDEDSTTDCEGVYERDSLWSFSEGTVEITNDSVALRLDSLQLADGVVCDDITLSEEACRCHNNAAGDCDDNSDCTGPPAEQCGPKATIGGYFVVRIFMQNYRYDTIPPYDTGIQRDETCYREVAFDLKNVLGNRNEQVNDSVNNLTVNCMALLSGHQPEIRHVEVVDKYGNIVAVGTMGTYD